MVGALALSIVLAYNNVVTSSRPPIVAIDGPAGAGKSVIARRLASALGFTHVDTGALYRSVALAAEIRGVSWEDGPALGTLTRELVENSSLLLEPSNSGGSRVRLFGNDVTDAIREVSITRGSSRVSAHPEVRAALLDLQRDVGKAGGVVLEGRDIGTVVFPNAEVKFFLTASPEIRARRRYDEMAAKSGTTEMSYDEVLADVRQRDVQDTERAIAPLRQAPGAIVIDSTAMTLDETVAAMVANVAKRA